MNTEQGQQGRTTEEKYEERSIEVNVPISTAYNQWTQFEEYPKFMKHVKEVRQIDNKHLHWCAEIGGREKEWDAEITEQIPDQRISWRAVSGTENFGTVTFESLGADKTKVVLRMGYDPEGFFENIAAALGFVGRRIEQDLKDFKEFIESRKVETGAWRGQI